MLLYCVTSGLALMQRRAWITRNQSTEIQNLSVADPIFCVLTGLHWTLCRSRLLQSHRSIPRSPDWWADFHIPNIEPLIVNTAFWDGVSNLPCQPGGTLLKCLFDEDDMQLNCTTAWLRAQHCCQTLSNFDRRDSNSSHDHTKSRWRRLPLCKLSRVSFNSSTLEVVV